jgi:hypothetical protein
MLQYSSIIYLIIVYLQHAMRKFADLRILQGSATSRVTRNTVISPTKQGDFTKNGHVHIKSSVITSKAWYMMLIVPKIVLNTGFWIAWFQGWVVTIQSIFPVDIDELNYMISSLLVQCWWFNGIIKYDAVNPPMSCAKSIFHVFKAKQQWFGRRSLCLRKS